MAGFRVTTSDGQQEYVADAPYYEIKYGALLIKNFDSKIIVGYGDGAWKKFERRA
jgi:hypothetical protein